ncbi:type VI secretion system baseplate subunit TssF [Aliiroseovarius sp.]|uniref:type VI secretion system baseplate subunit TssF n=1 Tax=Aliiroseovarius sp. TaxID=1872442 RepID=UPI003BACFD6F
MKKAFRDSYNRELAFLKERSGEFAADYPGLADRLGGLVEENMDPAIGGLLEGTAFMAARVQLKLDEEFRTFTHQMLDQVFPDALAPTPSAMLVQAAPVFDNKDIVQGVHFEAGEYMDARFSDADKRVACRFALAAPLTLWPLAIDGLKYHASPGTLGALGQDVAGGTKAGLEITLARVNTAGQTKDAGPLSELAVDELPFHFTGPEGEAIELYEQIHAGRLRVSLRYLDKFGDAQFLTLAPNNVQQIGFDDQPPLFPHQGALFSGFALLREAFVFPRKFLGFKLVGLRQALRRIRTDRMQLVLEFDRVNSKLATRLEQDHVQLFCAPAVNLFRESSSQVRLNNKRTEFVVTPDRSPLTHYEIYHLTEVFAHYAGHQNKERVLPLYGLPPDGVNPKQALYYTTRQKPRRLTAQERRFGATRHRYRGTETFISIYEPPDAEPAQRLQVNALCSNRHLTEYLPIAKSRGDFRLCEDQTIALSCLAGPTPPRESLLELDNRAGHRAADGDGHWRLISFLSLNFHGLLNDRSGKGAAPMRELLSLFANLSDSITQAQIDGLKEIETRPVVRTIRREDGFHPARGLMVSLTFDEDEFEGSGVILLGAILDRFLSEYAAVNSFTQCQVRSIQRGEIKTFPPRSGTGPLL